MSSGGRSIGDVERRVAEVLAERALEIPLDPDEADRPLPARAAVVDLGLVVDPVAPPGPRGRDRDRFGSVDGWGRRLAIAAAVVVVAAVGGVGSVLVGGTGNGGDGPDTDVRIETGADRSDPTAESGTAPADGVGDGDGDGDGAVPVATVESVVVALPEGVDPLRGSTLWLDGAPSTDPDEVARAYLADRLPDLAAEVELVDIDDRLSLFRWSPGLDDAQDLGGQDLDGLGGWLLIRLDDDRAGVVAATTDGVSLTSASHSGGAVSARLVDEFDEAVSVDITDLWGRILPGSSEPDRGGDGEITASVPPWPVAIRVQHLGGTRLTITEVVVDPTGFAPACGSVPPIEIEVGDRLGALAAGPVGASSIEPVDGQGVWHHEATEASRQTAVELRWPPDPTLIGRLPLGALEPGTSAVVALGPSIISADPGRRVTGEHHVVVVLGPGSATDPCALVQLSVLGDPATADWWSTALSGQSSFGLPLSLAGPDLDPLLGPHGAGGPSVGPGTEDVDLIVSATDGIDPADIPKVAAVGSCDGLPDDPPRTGVGDGSTAPTAAEALAAFVVGPGAAEEPPLPTTGYHEYRPNDVEDRWSYAVGFDDTAITVIEVERLDGAWQVVAWEAAPC